MLTAAGRLLDRDWLTLPPVRNTGPRGPRQVPLSAGGGVQARLEGSALEFAPLELQVVRDSEGKPVWTELTERHHYLAYRVPVGANRRYRYSRPGAEQPLACWSWSSPAWKMEPKGD